MTKMKCEHWTKKWNWSSCTKLALSPSSTHVLIAQLVRGSERNSVVVVSNPTQINFLSLLQISFSGEYRIYQFIPLLTWLPVRDFASRKSGDWRRQWPKWNVNTRQTHEIGLPLKTWLWMRVKLMAWKLSRLEHLNRIQWSWVQTALRPAFYHYFKNSSLVNTICIDSFRY